MEQPTQLDRLFALATQHRIPMATICKRADVDPATPSRWRRGKNGATLEKLNRLSEALAELVAETVTDPSSDVPVCVSPAERVSA